MKRAFIFVFVFLFWEPVCSWNDAGSVLLRDIQALTLYKGRYTTGRRSSPVPQLQCVGGSAGCHSFVPEVVQCQNKGWDGVDVQWECKTDMDNSYRFGRVEVSCEGFSHPSDPYVLAGSCGLEFTLELTEEGRRRGQGGGGGSQRGFGDFASSFFSGFSDHKSQQRQSSSFGSGGEDSGGLLVVVVLLLIAYGVYKVFLSGNSGTAPDPGDHRDSGHPGNTPPPPGFKPDYTSSSSTGYPGENPGYGFRSDFTQDQYPQYPHSRGRSNPNPAGGGGFWTGMGTGGLLGYLFGSQRTSNHRPYGHSYGNSYGRSYGHSNPFSRPFSSSSSSSPSSSSSSGTRTASGFGGTKKR